MESQMIRQDGDEQLPVMQGEGHHEKKSVMQNVKDKAKSKVRKIKHTLTKHGQGHDHDHDLQSHEDDDDDNDDDEELVQDPEVHAAPTAARHGVGAGHQPGVNLEKPTILEEDRHKNTISETQTKPFSQTEYTKPEHGEPTKPFSQAEHAKPDHGQFRNFKHGIDQGNPEGKVGIPSQMAEDKHVTIIDPQTRPFSHAKPEHEQFGNIGHGIDRTEGNPKDKIGTPTRMEEDPNVPKDGQEPSNYQSRVADPTDAGGAEAGITPILSSFDKLSVSDEAHPLPKSDDFDSPQEIFTGTHDKLSPEPIPENAPVDLKDPGSPLKTLASGGEKQSSYADKISFATSAITGKAIAAKDIVASKLGYGEKVGSGINNTGEKEGSGITNIGEKEGSGISSTGEKEGSGIANTGRGEQSGYTGKISSATPALTGKAIAAKDVVASKLGYGEKVGSGITNTGEKEGSGITNTDEKEGSGIANTGRGDQSGYTGKISSATSALTGKAIAAKDIVASKLGYGEKVGSGITNTGEKEGSGITNTGEKEGPGTLETGKGEPSGGVTATVANYANKAAATVTGVGSSVLSKVPGGPTGKNKEPNKVTEQTVENKGSNKGVTGYLSEKLRPSEEDKALSEVISDTLYRKKPENEDKPIGKVTVSDEVARKLGTKEDVKRENESVDAQVVGDVRPDVVERVKGWFGMGQSQSPHASQGDTNADNDQLSSSEAGGERRLQESAN